MKHISIKGISKEFHTLRGKVIALNNINLEVDPATFFVLLGPSGCGKSTLLNIVAGIEKPTAGEIQIGENPVVSAGKRIFLSPRERNVAMVFQSYALYPHLNVFDNIAFPLKIAKITKTDIRSQVERVAEILEIPQLLKAKPSELSGGQRQRVAIGRAIVRQPQVLLLDEPLSNLDAKLRVTMRAELKQLQRQLGMTTLYVTHDQVEAMNLGDEIAVMDDGQIMQVGSPIDIYHRPVNTFVASFVGTPAMNLLDGSILQHAKKKLPIIREYNPDEILIGIRPEHIRICDENDPADFEAKITMIGSQGSENVLYLTIDSHTMIAKSSRMTAGTEGDIVAINFDHKEMLLFNKRSKKLMP